MKDVGLVVRLVCCRLNQYNREYLVESCCLRCLRSQMGFVQEVCEEVLEVF